MGTRPPGLAAPLAPCQGCSWLAGRWGGRTSSLGGGFGLRGTEGGKKKIKAEHPKDVFIWARRARGGGLRWGACSLRCFRVRWSSSSTRSGLAGGWGCRGCRALGRVVLCETRLWLLSGTERLRRDGPSESTWCSWSETPLTLSGGEGSSPGSVLLPPRLPSSMLPHSPVLKTLCASRLPSSGDSLLL